MTTLDGHLRTPLNGAVTETLHQLEATIAARRDSDPASSYVAKLHAEGVAHIARKFGEEAVETVVAALSGGKAELIAEAADVVFHLLILLGAKGVTLADVEAELVRRDGTSGIAEKAARKE